MGFGAILASGGGNELLGQDLLDCLTEVRVEQFLDEPTRFAVRFQEDLGSGEPLLADRPELQPETVLTVAVEVDGAMKCLVRGPITEVKCSFKLGGPGSSVDVSGRDRRVELDRQCFRHAWSGRASDAALAILPGYGFVPDVESTTRVYDPLTGTLNQRATDLAFLNRIARQNNLSFWITYDCRLNGLGPAGGQLTVTETANLRASPERGGGAAAPLQLVPSVQVGLRVNVEKEKCPNVTSFDLDVDVERPNAFSGTALSDADLSADDTSATDPQPAVRPGGQGLRDVTGEERQVCITTAGDSQELQPRAESALTEAGWFVGATASTTAHMLGGVLFPHDVVEVEGLGTKHSGPYQVKSVTHVIQAAEHHMDLTLRRNAIGG